MLQERGRVVAVQDDAVWVETIRRSTCGACAARQGCGHGLLNRQTGSGRGLVRVLSGEALRAGDCRVGDEVLLELPEEVILRGSMIVYMVPLLAALAGAAASQAMSGWFTALGLPADALSAGGAACGLLAGFAVVRWHGRRHRADPWLQPVLARRLDGGPSPGGPSTQEAQHTLNIHEVDLHV